MEITCLLLFTENGWYQILWTDSFLGLAVAMPIYSHSGTSVWFCDAAIPYEPCRSRRTNPRSSVASLQLVRGSNWGTLSPQPRTPPHTCVSYWVCGLVCATVASYVFACRQYPGHHVGSWGGGRRGWAMEHDRWGESLPHWEGGGLCWCPLWRIEILFALYS